MKKIKELETLASEMVGDGGKPNLFFVSDNGVQVMVTRDFVAAHQYWRNLVCQRKDAVLEDRETGTIADVSTYGSTDRRRVSDLSIQFGFMRKDGSYK